MKRKVSFYLEYQTAKHKRARDSSGATALAVLWCNGYNVAGLVDVASCAWGPSSIDPAYLRSHCRYVKLADARRDWPQFYNHIMNP